MSFHNAVNSGILVSQTCKKQLIQDGSKVIDLPVMINNNITQLTVIKVDRWQAVTTSTKLSFITDQTWLFSSNITHTFIIPGNNINLI